ncbi:GntR family transcriptional regulator [Streptomyces alkaliphilus]|uniref:GntR family transcriptional regulator n=1 Tax=Streptomyces alkaliphilus TaxID=1472722 RepID=UPI00117BDFED|nr:GntR family transcriptional regulator [Streptomyces alkaliphilus]
MTIRCLIGSVLSIEGWGVGLGGVIRRSTLREQLAEALRDEILAGRLAPGREFTVREIAEQYGVSATPVREALVDLTAQGLLETRQHRGFRVHAYSFDDFARMLEARALVGEGVVRATRSPIVRSHPEPDPAVRSPGAMTSVRRRAAAARDAALAGDLDILVAYDLRFWRELTALLGNPYLAEFLDRLRVRCWAFVVPRLRGVTGLRGRLWSGHPELTEAVERRDAALIEEQLGVLHHSFLALARLGGDPDGESGSGSAASDAAPEG